MAKMENTFLWSAETKAFNSTLEPRVAALEASQKEQDVKISVGEATLNNLNNSVTVNTNKLNNLYKEILLNINTDFRWSNNGGVYYNDIEVNLNIKLSDIISATLHVSGGTSTIAKVDNPLLYLNLSERNTAEIWVNNKGNVKFTYPEKWYVKLIVKG